MQEFSQKGALLELHDIASWWLDHACDTENGGFYGEIDFHGKPVPNANKGIILNSRILWFFSELALSSHLHASTPLYKSMAERAFKYIMEYFDDKEKDGVVWELDAKGKVINSKKQIYAQCFCIYGFTAYYKLSKDTLAKEKALVYFQLIEDKARDLELGGYIEAMTNSWGELSDFRLSDKDLNAPKTMNTHLHILEAYSALHANFPTDKTKEALTNIIQIFKQVLINHETGHLKLFFDQHWNDESLSYSFGHDIEASWLLWEALEVLDDKSLTIPFRPVVIKMAETSLHEGLGDMGQLCDDFILATGKRNNDSIWWVQAEALIGFLNAYKLTGKTQYLQACKRVWYYISQFHKDQEAGEWHWLGTEQKQESSENYKAGFWKAPYHNGRAMIEISKRLAVLNKGLK